MFNALSQLCVSHLTTDPQNPIAGCGPGAEEQVQQTDLKLS